VSMSSGQATILIRALIGAVQEDTAMLAYGNLAIVIWQSLWRAGTQLGCCCVRHLLCLWNHALGLDMLFCLAPHFSTGFARRPLKAFDHQRRNITRNGVCISRGRGGSRKVGGRSLSTGRRVRFYKKRGG